VRTTRLHGDSVIDNGTYLNKITCRSYARYNTILFWYKPIVFIIIIIGFRTYRRVRNFGADIARAPSAGGGGGVGVGGGGAVDASRRPTTGVS